MYDNTIHDTSKLASPGERLKYIREQLVKLKQS